MRVRADGPSLSFWEFPYGFCLQPGVLLSFARYRTLRCVPGAGMGDHRHRLPGRREKGSRFLDPGHGFCMVFRSSPESSGDGSIGSRRTALNEKNALRFPVSGGILNLPDMMDMAAYPVSGEAMLWRVQQGVGGCQVE